MGGFYGGMGTLGGKGHYSLGRQPQKKLRTTGKKKKKKSHKDKAHNPSEQNRSVCPILETKLAAFARGLKGNSEGPRK